jgi:hypothetical protein
MVSPMDVAWAILKADPYSPNQRALQQALGPVHGHLRNARDQAQQEAEKMPYSTDPKVRATQGPMDYLFAGMDIKPELMRPPIPSDAQEDREMRETVAGDSPQRRLNRFEQRTGRPPSDKEMMMLINEQRAGVPEHESFSANYAHLDDIFGQ